ncbi:MAG: hypothetical protein NTW80_05165 [Deltaproteobacteria bacterium]|nr:hypothetical protein [Deltaproteobacteria bacterium]
MVAVNCLLLLAIVRIWWGGPAGPAATRSGKGPELPQTPTLRDQQPLSAFRVVSAKDLFAQDRTGPEEQPAKAQATLEGRQLVGIMIIGSERMALISAKASPVPGRPVAQATQVDVVRQGEDYAGFKVVEISNEAVVLQGKDGKKTLNFPE